MSEAKVNHIVRIIKNGWDPEGRGYRDEHVREARRRVAKKWRGVDDEDVLDAGEAHPLWTHNGEVVYYLRFCCRVSIGFTDDLAEARRSVPHHEVLAIEPGGRLVESERHARFADLRDVGEWFKYGPALKSYVLELRGAGPMLADTEVAVEWSGRDRSVIYRWASEGRLTRYGGTGKAGARWDLREIPQWGGRGSGVEQPGPPEKKISGNY